MRVGRLSQFLLSKREMDAQGISYLTHEEWTDTTGQQILTKKKKKKKGKHRERSKLHPFSPSARIYTYIYIWLCTYIYVYIQRLTPPNVKEGSQIAWRDGRFETEVPSTEAITQRRGTLVIKRRKTSEGRNERNWRHCGCPQGEDETSGKSGTCVPAMWSEMECSFPERPTPLGYDGVNKLGSSVHCSQAPGRTTKGVTEQSVLDHQLNSIRKNINPEERKGRGRTKEDLYEPFSKERSTENKTRRDGKV